MKRTIILVLLATACGDDDPANTGAGDSSSSSSGASTTPGAATTDSSLDTSSGTSSTGTADSTSAEISTTLAETSAATTSGDESSTGEPGEGCLPPAVFAAIDQHAHDLASTAGLLAGQPSEVEATGFMLAPGLPEPPALSGSFASLFMICAEPVLFDEYCEEGRCSQLECTGKGASWINHLWVEPALVEEGWSFEEVLVNLRWMGGTGVLFDIETMSSGPGGEDISMSGVGEMDVDGMSVTETFPSVHPAGETVLEYADDGGGYSGQLTIADVVVAMVDVGGHLVPTGACP